MENSADYIMNSAKGVYREALDGAKRDTLLKKYSAFYEAYPKIFDGCLNATFDFNMLEFMLKSREQIKENKDDVNTVDADVIGHLKDIYVNPILKRLNIPTDQLPDPAILKRIEEAARLPMTQRSARMRELTSGISGLQ